MANTGIAITAADEKEFRPVKPESAGASRFTFGRFLLLSTISLTIILGYESIAQRMLPAISLLAAAHDSGYLKWLPVASDPGKGVWLLLGWVGSGMMAVMMLYSLRKRLSLLSSLGSMRRWLNAHMFLGIMGPLFITFHTTFKFNGLIATSYWCMMVTMVFGILGRYIYVQIPRSISGAEMGVREIEDSVAALDIELGRYLRAASIASLLNEISSPETDGEGISSVRAFFITAKTDLMNIFRVMRLNLLLKERYRLSKRVRAEVAGLLGKKAALIRKRNFLSASHRLLHYWHVFHIPLAIVMFLIMFIHVAVYYLFRS